MKGKFGVAFAAIASEFILMHICMAISATGKSDTGKFLELFPVEYFSFVAALA